MCNILPSYSKISTPFVTYLSGCSGLSHSAVIGNSAQVTQMLMVWGRNDRGQLGTGDTALRTAPVEPNWAHTMMRSGDAAAYASTVVQRPKFISVACGEDSTFAVTDSGKVYSWGSNDYGQLGISDMTAEMLKTPSGLYYRSFPYFISSLQRAFIVAITAGAYHVAVLSDTGQVYLWGSNSEGPPPPLPSAPPSRHATPRAKPSPHARAVTRRHRSAGHGRLLPAQPASAPRLLHGPRHGGQDRLVSWLQASRSALL